jgi:hypothetical protein
LHLDKASFFTREFLTKNNMAVVLHQPYFSASTIEDKAERLPFDTSEVIEAESQVVLYTLTEHDFQDAYKYGRSAGYCAY